MMEKYKNKKIAILGFGVEGMSICDFLIEIGSSIVVLDEKNRPDFEEKVLKSYEDRGIKFSLGKIEKIEGFDYIFRSPGFHPGLYYLENARKNGTEVTSATKLFFELCPCPITGVTGTKGKGTTSTLIYEMLKEQGYDTYLGGNIGVAPLSFLPHLKKDSRVVLELSSFQLIDLEKSPHVGVILMTTSEHLNYHKDVYEYVESKRNIFKYQDVNDFAIVNRDYPASNESDIHSNGKVYKVSREQEVEQGCFVRGKEIYLKMDGHEEAILPTKDLLLPGKHNWENVCAAIVAALCSGATMKSILPVLKSFKGLEHRLELVATIRGVKYYNDSFSTTPETAIAAIEAFDEPKVLILGGSSKNSDFTELGQVIGDSKSIKAIIQLGDEWEKIRKEIKRYSSDIKIYEECQNMRDVVQKASEISEIGDIVLLSPACASFDRFKSYKDRGDQFRDAVGSLPN